MSIGMQIPTVAPRPLARGWATAMTTYGQLLGPEYEPDERGVKRWLNGVQFTPFGCEKIVGALFDPCVERNTEAQSFGEIVAFDPVLAEVAVECTTLSVQPETLAAYVAAHTEVSRSSVFAAQVERAAFTTTNPSLVSEAQVIAGADTTILGVLYAVEEALADLLDGGVGMLHMSAGMLSVLQSSGGLRLENGVAYTATGHSIVADAGYLGVSPITGDVVADESWIYGSGPVFMKVDDTLTIVGNPWENIDYSRNIMRIDGEQYALALFDPCSVVAAKVDMSVAPAL